MLQFDLTEIKDMYTFEQYLDQESVTQNFIWMLLQGDEDYKEQGVEICSNEFLKNKAFNVLNFNLNNSNI